MYLLFYSAIVIFLLGLFFRGSRKKDPSRLRFGPRALPHAEADQSPLSLPPTSSFVDVEPLHSRRKKSFARPLNVFFMFNGETFDAYEILGVPAGCSYAAAKEHYAQSFAARPENERRLYDAAILALEKIKKSAVGA